MKNYLFLGIFGILVSCSFIPDQDFEGKKILLITVDEFLEKHMASVKSVDIILNQNMEEALVPQIRQLAGQGYPVRLLQPVSSNQSTHTDFFTAYYSDISVVSPIMVTKSGLLYLSRDATKGIYVPFSQNDRSWKDYTDFLFDKYSKMEGGIDNCFRPDFTFPKIELADGMIQVIENAQEDIFSVISETWSFSQPELFGVWDWRGNEELAGWVNTFSLGGDPVNLSVYIPPEWQNSTAPFCNNLPVAPDFSCFYDYKQKRLLIWNYPALPRYENDHSLCLALEISGDTGDELFTQIQTGVIREDQAEEAFFPGNISTAERGDLFITETGFIYEGGEWKGDFIELFNMATNWLDLSGVQVIVRSAYRPDLPDIFRFPTYAVIGPGKCLVIASDRGYYSRVDYYWEDMFLYSQGMSIEILDVFGRQMDIAGDTEVSFTAFGGRVNYSARERSITRLSPLLDGQDPHSWTGSQEQTNLYTLGQSLIWATPGHYKIFSE